MPMLLLLFWKSRNDAHRRFLRKNVIPVVYHFTQRRPNIFYFLYLIYVKLYRKHNQGHLITLDKKVKINFKNGQNTINI